MPRSIVRSSLALALAALVVTASACSSTSGTASGSGSPAGGSVPTDAPGGTAPGTTPGTTRVTNPTGAASAASMPGPSRSPGCDAATPLPAGPIERTITSDGVERKFQVTIPKDYDGTRPLPILFGLHALTVSYTFVPSMTGFGDFPQYPFLGVAPSGRVAGTTPYWLAAPSQDNYDLDFFNQLLDELEADYCVDETRVFSTGMSNGAQMSSELACRMPDRVTAVAPVAGVEFFDTCAGRPVPVIAFHGAKDPIVTYEGGGLNGTTIANQQFWRDAIPAGMPVHKGVDAAMATWAEHNGCDPTYVEERISAEVRKRTWNGCEAATILYVVDNGGHAWPGKPQPAFEKSFGHGTTDIDASKLIFDFFFAPPST